MMTDLEERLSGPDGLAVRQHALNALEALQHALATALRGGGSKTEVARWTTLMASAVAAEQVMAAFDVRRHHPAGAPRPARVSATRTISPFLPAPRTA